MAKNSDTNAYDDVRTLNLRAKELLARYGRQAVEARKTDFIDPAAKKVAEEHAAIIEKDITELSEKIGEVEKKHAKWAPAPKSGRDYQRALQVGSEYVEIMDQAQSTAGTSAVELVCIMNDNNIQADEASKQPTA